jgi:hypothetical protein
VGSGCEEAARVGGGSEGEDGRAAVPAGE